MRIWLDDNRPMPKTFDVHFKTAQECIKFIADNIKDIEYISFDHDLGIKEIVGDGYEVATFIEKLAWENKIQRIGWKVHSANPPGEKNIIAAMKSAERFWNLFENDRFL